MAHDVVDHVMEEIAIDGEEGSSIPQLLQYIRDFYCENETPCKDMCAIMADLRSTKIYRNKTLKAPTFEDVLYREYIWKMLLEDKDFRVGKMNEGHEMSFEDVINGVAPSEEAKRGGERTNISSDEAVPTESAIVEKPGESAAEASMEEDELDEPTYKWRVYVSKARRWRAIAGHEPDSRKVPPTLYKLLEIIAKSREDGLIQPELTRISGQDKKSVPPRTKALFEKGYIEKIGVLAAKMNTSKLTLTKFATLRDKKMARKQLDAKKYNEKAVVVKSEYGIDWTRNAIQLDDLCNAVFTELRNAKNKTMMHTDLKSKLGMAKSKFHWRAFSRLIRRLESFGVLKRIRVPLQLVRRYRKKGPGPDRQIVEVCHARCIRMIREMREQEWRRINSWSKNIATAAAEGEDKGDKEADEEEDIQGQTEDIEEGAVAQLTAVEAVPELVRDSPVWNPAKPMSRLVFDLVDSAGTEGVSSMQLREKLCGNHYYRPMDQILHRLSDFPMRAQAKAFRDLAIVRETSISGRTTHYRFFSYPNYNKLVEAGLATAAAKVKKNKYTSSASNMVDDNDESNALDEMGFPIPDSSRMLKKSGRATFAESEAACLKTQKPIAPTVINSLPGGGIKVGFDGRTHGHGGRPRKLGLSKPAMRRADIEAAIAAGDTSTPLPRLGRPPKIRKPGDVPKKKRKTGVPIGRPRKERPPVDPNAPKPRMGRPPKDRTAEELDKKKKSKSNKKAVTKNEPAVRRGRSGTKVQALVDDDESDFGDVDSEGEEGSAPQQPSTMTMVQVVIMTPVHASKDLEDEEDESAVAEETPAPKRRGRQPKSASTAKGKGKMPKSSSAGHVEKENETLRANTSKDVEGDPMEIEETPAPKRSGRPPKKKLATPVVYVSSDAEEEIAEIAETPIPTRKGRSLRSRPATASKGGPENPPTADGDLTSLRQVALGAGGKGKKRAAAEVPDETPAPKRRGRPPKATQGVGTKKDKLAEEERRPQPMPQGEVVPSPVKAQPVTTQKLGRGRPPTKKPALRASSGTKNSGDEEFPQTDLQSVDAVPTELEKDVGGREGQSAAFRTRSGRGVSSVQKQLPLEVHDSSSSLSYEHSKIPKETSPKALQSSSEPAPRKAAALENSASVPDDEEPASSPTLDTPKGARGRGRKGRGRGGTTRGQGKSTARGGGSKTQKRTIEDGQEPSSARATKVSKRNEDADAPSSAADVDGAVPFFERAGSPASVVLPFSAPGRGRGVDKAASARNRRLRRRIRSSRVTTNSGGRLLQVSNMREPSPDTPMSKEQEESAGPQPEQQTPQDTNHKTPEQGLSTPLARQSTPLTSIAPVTPGRASTAATVPDDAGTGLLQGSGAAKPLEDLSVLSIPFVYKPQSIIVEGIEVSLENLDDMHSYSMTGGMLALQRQQTVLSLLKAHDGVFPGNNELRYAFHRKFRDTNPQAGCPDRRLMRAIVENLQNAGNMRQFTFEFTTSRSMHCVKKVVALSDVSIDDHRIAYVVKKLVKADGSLWYPPGVDLMPNVIKRIVQPPIWHLPRQREIESVVFERPSVLDLKARRQIAKLDEGKTVFGPKRARGRPRGYAKQAIPFSDEHKAEARLLKKELRAKRQLERLNKKYAGTGRAVVDDDAPQQVWWNDFVDRATCTGELLEHDGLNVWAEICKVEAQEVQYGLARPDPSKGLTMINHFGPLVEVTFVMPRIENIDHHMRKRDYPLPKIPQKPGPKVQDKVYVRKDENGKKKAADVVALPIRRRKRATKRPRLGQSRRELAMAEIHKNELGEEEIQGAIPPRKHMLRNKYTMPREDEDTLFVAVLIVRTLFSPADRKIDWKMVNKALPQHAELVLKRRWARVREIHKTHMKKLSGEFEGMYLDAYKKDKVPTLDLQDPEKFDLPWHVKWFRDNLEVPEAHAIPKFPATRQEFDALYDTLVDVPANWRSEYFNINLTNGRRHNQSLCYAYEAPLTQQPEPTQAKDAFEFSKSVIKANIMTEEKDYDSQIAYDVLRSQPEDAVDEAFYDLVCSKAIAPKKDRSRIKPGRNYELTDKYHQILRTPLDEKLMRQAVGFHKEITNVFEAGETKAVSPLFSDGAVACLIDMIVQRKASLKKEGYQAKPMGLITGYHTRGMPKERIDFKLIIEPGPSYSASPEPQDLVPIPKNNPEDKLDPIRIWYTMNHELVPGMWRKAVVVVLGMILTRPGVELSMIYNDLKPGLTWLEVREVVEWLQKSGVVESGRMGIDGMWARDAYYQAFVGL